MTTYQDHVERLVEERYVLRVDLNDYRLGYENARKKIDQIASIVLSDATPKKKCVEIESALGPWNLGGKRDVGT